MQNQNYVRQKLCELLSLHGLSLIDDPRRLKAFLADTCFNCKKEISVLSVILEEKAVDQLLKIPQSQTPIELSINRLVKHICDNRYIDKEGAQWAVESWALALGVIPKDEIGASSDSTEVKFSHKIAIDVRGFLQQNINKPLSQLFIPIIHSKFIIGIYLVGAVFLIYFGLMLLNGKPLKVIEETRDFYGFTASKAALITNDLIYSVQNPHYSEDWKLIYDINRSQLNGSGLQKVAGDVSPLTSNLIVKENYLFFLEKGSLKVVSINGAESKRTLLPADNQYVISSLLKDDWIYYLYSPQSASLSSRSIYKIKLNGTSKTRFIELNTGVIADLCAIVENWLLFKVYEMRNNRPFASIYKIKLDRSGLMKIVTNPSGSINETIVSGNLIYYTINYSEMDELYKVSIDGGETTFLFSDTISNICLYKNDFYYLNKNKWLYRVKSDGTRKTKLCNQKIDWFYICNNQIYFYTINTKNKDGFQPNSDCEYLYQIKIDGSHQKKLY